jgi:filamentous hemagglutinin family protein
MKAKLQQRTATAFGTPVQHGAALRMVVPVLSVFFAHGAHALPQNGQVVAGTGTVAQAGVAMTVTQTSPKLAINWQGFDIAAGQTVNFAQPGASSIVLNRVLGQNPTSILGNLTANGQVFVVNPSGIVFGAGSQVNVGGLVASSHPITDADFLAGTYRFIGSGGGGAVINQGNITAADGGYVALIGRQVQNGGGITANRGAALLAGGDQVTLQLNGSSLLGYTIDRGTLNALAQNQLGGSIRADGGKVILSARAANQAATAVVNNDGIIEARTIGQSGGVIQLLGDMAVGQVNQNGRLDASAPNGGNGGSIEISAAKVKVGDGAQFTTASPAGPGSAGKFSATANDFTIDRSGRGADLSTTVLQNTLDNNASVTIATSTAAGAGAGDINLAFPATWSANSALNLVADRNVILNATAQSAGGGKLLLRADSGGKGAGTVSISNGIAPLMQGGQVDIYYNPASFAAPINYAPSVGGTLAAWMLVNDLAHLQAMNTNLAGNYALGRNVDASTSAGMNNGNGFNPVGNAATPYSGQFDGLGQVISGLTINRIGAQEVGLFGVTSGSASNVGLEGASIAGLRDVGALAGTNLGTITRSYSTGTVSIPVTDPINGFAGGLVGNNAGLLDKTWSSAAVSGNASNIGGLAGINNGNITESYSSGSATATGNNAGGIAGQNAGTGQVFSSYSAAAVSATSQAGGIAGTNDGRIVGSYSSGATSGVSSIGGIAGRNTGSINSTYSSGTTRGGVAVGPLAGVNTGTISANSVGNISSDAAKLQGTYAALDFSANGVWRQYDGSTLPLLRAFLKPLTLTVKADSKTYDGTPWSGQLHLTYSDPAAATSPSLHIGQPVTSALPVDAGTYTVNYTLAPYSDQRNGYDITVAQAGPQNSTLTIDPKIIGVTGMTAANRAYDGTVNATVNGGTLQGTAGAQTLGLTTVATFNDKNAGSNKPVNAIARLQDGLNGGKASNYVLTNPVGLTATISPRDLTVSPTAANKVYDGTTADTATLAGNQLAGDVLTLNYGAANFADKNAGNGKVVTVTGVTIVGGTDAANYRVAQPTVTSAADITPRPVTVAATADDKRFDGTVAATANVNVNVTSNNVLANDVLTAGYTQASFSDAFVGQDKAVTVRGITLSGVDAANYALQQNTANTTASIIPSSSIPGLDLVTLLPISTTNGTILAGLLPGIYATTPAGPDATNFGVWTAAPTGRTGQPAAVSTSIGVPDFGPAAHLQFEFPTPAGNGAGYTFGVTPPGIRMPEGFQ